MTKVKRVKKTQQISLRLPFHTSEELKRMSKGIGKSAFIRELIERAARRSKQSRTIAE